jgi:hypothetical protein
MLLQGKKEDQAFQDIWEYCQGIAVARQDGK